MLFRHIRKSILLQKRYYATSQQPCLGIRREDNSVWERRAPLSPSHVRQLVKQGVKVLVQPSNRRAYPMQAYANAGAHIREDMTEAPVILGVKQVPIDLLEPEKTYVFFSHTIKAQEANLPLLDAILQKNIRLIDYEKMTNDKGQRVVAFGKYAGVAGMINILHGLGLRLLALGHHTPFMHIGPAHNYRSSGMACQGIRDAGYEISLGMMPNSLGPLIFIFTGAGNVSQGAQEIFQELPHEYVSVDNLSKVAKHGVSNKVYGCVVDMEDNLVRKSDGKFDQSEYFDHPERYASTFSVKVAPYSSVIVNGIYYAPGAPRFLTLPDAKNLLRPQLTPWIPNTDGCPQLPHRLLAICDISADPGGSIEFMHECTSIDHPFMLYDADQNTNKESFSGSGVLLCSIDNMPAQLPLEATDYFGNGLIPYVMDMIMSDAKTPFDEYNADHVVKNAVIASNGELTPNFKYIQGMRQKRSQSAAAVIAAQSSDRKVLILGSGYVSAPVVDYLTRDAKVAVTVASQVKEEIDRLAATYPNTTPVMLDIHRSEEDLTELIKAHDLVVSLLPYSLHTKVAELCIAKQTNMVTASYRSPQMFELNNAAVDAGITVMNEVGVDPGIDHLLAMDCFDEVAQHGGKVKSYVSWCGGLPAPEDAGNALRYKFSWSPQGVLLNILSGAKYLKDGQVREIAPGNLLDSAIDLNIMPGFNLQGFPNRDSTVYSELYGIQSAHTILRGTLRYKGFTEAMKGLHYIGLIDAEEHSNLHPGGPDISWREFICALLGKKSDIFVDSLKDLVFEKVGRDKTRLEAIMQLGLLDDELVDKKGSPIATLSNYLSKRLNYSSGERDMILMHHDVGIKWPDNSEETRHISLPVYGQPIAHGSGYLAMAATVGFPTGIAAKMILDGEIQSKGVVLPFTQDIYRPMLRRLKLEGIEAREHITHGQSIPLVAENVSY